MDIDGTLFKNCGEYSTPSWGFNEPIKENVEFIKKLQKEQNIQLILTTARKSKYRKETINQLELHNIKYSQLIMDLFHCRRFLINDYCDTNPFPSASAVNLKRNDNNLSKILI